MELSMEKVPTLTKIKIHTLDGGNSVRRKEKAPIFMLILGWSWLGIGNRIRLYKENGFSPMEHFIADSLNKINQMEKEFGQ